MKPNNTVSLSVRNGRFLESVACSIENSPMTCTNACWQLMGTGRWFSKYGKAIGVYAYGIPKDLQLLIDDCKYWIAHDTDHQTRLRRAFTLAMSISTPTPVVMAAKRAF